MSSSGPFILSAHETYADLRFHPAEPILPPPPALRPPATPDFSLPPMRITPVTLFRFSALTFNAHLIHYSLPYCRDVEALPGTCLRLSPSPSGRAPIPERTLTWMTAHPARIAPLIHAPLTALLLLDLVRAQLPSPAWRIASFEYRATSPLVVGQSLDLVGSWAGESGTDSRACDVWAVGESGQRVGMTGRAELVRTG